MVSGQPSVTLVGQKMEDVFVDGTMQDEMRYVINQE